MSMAVNIGFINYYFNKVFIKVYIIGFLADKIITILVYIAEFHNRVIES